jgi:hypothetical protein
MGKKPATAEKRAHLNLLKRRYKLTQKAERGTITDAERTELAAMPVKKGGGPGRPRKAIAQIHTRGPVDNDHHAMQTAPQDAAGDESPGSPPSVDSPPPPPPLEPPPAVEVIPRGASGDWRAKYRGGGSLGREATCVQVADLYCGILRRAALYVESKGGTPIIKPLDMETVVKPSAVLLADALIPQDFELRPEHEVAIYSGVVLGQAVVVAAKQKKPAGGPSYVRPPTPPPAEPPIQRANGAPVPDPVKPHEPSKEPRGLDDPRTIF